MFLNCSGLRALVSYKPVSYNKKRVYRARPAKFVLLLDCIKLVY